MTGRSPGLSIVGLAAIALTGCFSEIPDLLPRPVSAPVDGSPDPEPDGRVPLDGGERDADVGRPDLAPDEELCNRRDDDGDGVTDEGFEVGDPCSAGQGACEAQGETICAPGGRSVVCGAVPLAPRPEACNGIDDDCAGDVDEAFPDLDDPCTAGEGICAVTGAVRCRDDGQGTECSASAADELQRLEACNGEDDDCDGVVDEELISSCRLELPGLCADGVRRCVDGSWGACVGNVSQGERNDVCNLVDDDCDGSPDEDVLPDGPQRCVLCDELDGCVPLTPCVTQCDPESPLGTVCRNAPETACNGIDDDCDGGIDDKGACSSRLESSCRMLMGWTDRPLEAPAAAWGMCDFGGGGLGDGVSCNQTRPGTFAEISLLDGVDVDRVDDRLGVAFRCDGDAIEDYVASHCRVFLGISRPGVGVADGSDSWGPCPGEVFGGGDMLACTSSTLDGGFQPLPVPFDLSAGSYMGIAFVCEDDGAAGRARARAMSDAIELALGWADSTVDFGQLDWETTCTPLGDGDPYTACARTPRGGGFGVMQLTADVDAGDRFAISLRARGR